MSEKKFKILTLSDSFTIMRTLEVGMTDGPFRNSELKSGWKKYGEDLVNDATSGEERAARVCENMLDDADTKEVHRVILELKAQGSLAQQDLDPVSIVNAIFDDVKQSNELDFLQRHLIANLHDKIPWNAAIDAALESSVKDILRVAKNRIDEECIKARDLRHMTKNEYEKGLVRNRETFASVKVQDLSDAFATGNRKAFKASTNKKTGIGDGPEE